MHRVPKSRFSVKGKEAKVRWEVNGFNGVLNLTKPARQNKTWRNQSAISFKTGFQPINYIASWGVP